MISIGLIEDIDSTNRRLSVVHILRY